MADIRTILLPTDLSDTSTAAFPWAREMAKKTGARILLAHVTMIPVLSFGHILGPIGLPSVQGQVLEYARKKLNELREQLGDDVEVECHLVAGDTYVELVGLASRDDVDMVIIATHGHSGLKHAMLGSVAEKMVRSSPRPVLTVQAHPEN